MNPKLNRRFVFVYAKKCTLEHVRFFGIFGGTLISKMDERTYTLLRYISDSQTPVGANGLPAWVVIEFGNRADLSRVLFNLSKQGFLHRTKTGADDPYYGLFSINEAGKEALKYNEQKFINKALQERIEFELSKLQLKNIKMVNGSYWWTFAIAIIGALTGLGSLLIILIKD